MAWVRVEAANSSSAWTRASTGSSRTVRPSIGARAGNSAGFLDGFRSSRHYISCAVIAAEGDAMQRDDWYSSERRAADLAGHEQRPAPLVRGAEGELAECGEIQPLHGQVAAFGMVSRPMPGNYAPRRDLGHAAIESPGLKLGQNVVHAKFGRGVVTDDRVRQDDERQRLGVRVAQDGDDGPCKTPECQEQRNHASTSRRRRAIA